MPRSSSWEIFPMAKKAKTKAAKKKGSRAKGGKKKGRGGT
jgi:hypothetical protein